MGRVFHTSDWHLGRQIGRHRRDAEVDAVLNEIVEIAADFAPDRAWTTCVAPPTRCAGSGTSRR